MCGIICAHLINESLLPDFKHEMLKCSKFLRHRGPDMSGIVCKNRTILCHERLAIVGIDSGAQPIVSKDGSLILAVNGEIYNYKALKSMLRTEREFQTKSDCEVIMYLYEDYGPDFADMLDGMFSFVLYDSTKDRIIVARDPVGVTTLYRGYHSDRPETMFFASEAKGLQPICDKFENFPPGHYFDSFTEKTERYYKPDWLISDNIPTKPVDYIELRNALVEATRKRLMSEVPYGVLLSGGLDSSLIASIAAREVRKINLKKDQNGFSVNEQALHRSLPRLHSFSIGLPNAPDLAAAREVAKFIDTDHHEFTFTLEEGLNAIQDVIYHLESYDVTTIRASTPMFLLSRRIKAMGIKMVLSGEGSDEIFGGYLYFANAPNHEEFHQECKKRIQNLHLADNLRANKSTMAWGLEARVPFLDKLFLKVSMSIDPREKMINSSRKEKYILRKAFDVTEESDEEPFLPHEVLWRQKEQFSDGVGYSWIDCLKETAEKTISDAEFAAPDKSWKDDIPLTKEAFWYRKMFDNVFSEKVAATVNRWIPKADWGCHADPSGRCQKTHESFKSA